MVIFLSIIFFVFLYLFYRKIKTKSKTRTTFFCLSLLSLCFLLLNIFQAYSYRHNVHEVYGCLNDILNTRYGGYVVIVEGESELYKPGKYSEFYFKDEDIGYCFKIKFYKIIWSKKIINFSRLNDGVN